MVAERYTAEHRGGDLKEELWEWCVIDEFVSSPVVYGVTEEEAKDIANELNKESKE